MSRSTDDPILTSRPGPLFVMTTVLVYVICEWIKYELAPSPGSPPQPTLIRLFEWLPVCVSQLFALTAILGTVVLLLRTSSRLYRKPSQFPSSNGEGRIVRSLFSGGCAAFTYFVSVMLVFKLWTLNNLTLQLGITIGVQLPLFRVCVFSSRSLLALQRSLFSSRDR